MPEEVNEPWFCIKNMPEEVNEPLSAISTDIATTTTENIHIYGFSSKKRQSNQNRC